MIGKKLFDEFETPHRSFDLITTNISHVLRKSLLKDVQTRRYIDEGVRNYQTTFGSTMQTSCIKGSS
jgi:hypothetical protein